MRISASRSQKISRRCIFCWIFPKPLVELYYWKVGRVKILFELVTGSVRRVCRDQSLIFFRTSRTCYPIRRYAYGPIRRSPFSTERRLSRTTEWITYRILRKIYLIKNRNYLSCEERSFHQRFQFNWNLFIPRDLYERRSRRFKYYLYLFRVLYVSSKIWKKLAISVTSSLNFVKLFRQIKVRSSLLRRV